MIKRKIKGVQFFLLSKASKSFFRLIRGNVFKTYLIVLNINASFFKFMFIGILSLFVIKRSCSDSYHDVNLILVRVDALRSITPWN